MSQTHNTTKNLGKLRARTILVTKQLQLYVIDLQLILQ